MSNLSQEQRDFISNAYTWAENAELSGAAADLAVAQAAHESAYGRSLPGTNNYFGMKGPGTSSKTHEMVDGKRVNITDDFRNFETPEESFRQWGALMSRNYPGVLTADNMYESIDGLNIGDPDRPSYATDANYNTRMFEYMGRLHDLGYDIGLDDLPVQVPTGKRISQTEYAVNALANNTEPPSHNQFAPGGSGPLGKIVSNIGAQVEPVTSGPVRYRDPIGPGDRTNRIGYDGLVPRQSPSNPGSMSEDPVEVIKDFLVWQQMPNLPGSLAGRSNGVPGVTADVNPQSDPMRAMRDRFGGRFVGQGPSIDVDEALRYVRGRPLAGTESGFQVPVPKRRPLR